MLRLSIRKGDSTIFFGPPRWSEVDGADLTATQVQSRLAGMRVLGLIHGYNVEDAFDAYARIAIHMDDSYDEVVGVEWPGSKLDLAFWLARMRAGKAGRLLAEELGPIYSAAAALDIEGHSLGCMVALEALSAGLRCRNLVLTAAAVDNESIQAEERYWIATQRAHQILVAYSRHDPVLAGAYRIAMADRALGLTGPEDAKRVCSSVIALDLSNDISEHSQYKACGRLFSTWRNLL